jgi:hypothetical protein
MLVWSANHARYQRAYVPYQPAPQGRGAGLRAAMTRSRRSKHVFVASTRHYRRHRKLPKFFEVVHFHNQHQTSRPTPPRADPPPLYSLSLSNGDDSDDGNTFLAGHVVTGLHWTSKSNVRYLASPSPHGRLVATIYDFAFANSRPSKSRRPTTSCTSLTCRPPVLRPRSHHRLHLGARSPVLCPRCRHRSQRHVVDVGLAR